MTERKTDPVRPADDAARRLAQGILAGARFGALGVLEPGTGSPLVSRVAVMAPLRGQPVALISALSQHSGALRAEPACSLLLGEPGERGDPLSHPRLTLQCRARFVPRSAAEHAGLREGWLERYPKAKLYVDFADFGFVRFDPERGFLNGGFGQAFALTPGDLALPD